jgi:hypothetical protein
MPDSKRYEVNERKVNAFMHDVIFQGYTNKPLHHHKYTADKKIFFKREEIEKAQIPITGEGAQGTFDLALCKSIVEMSIKSMNISGIIIVLQD